MNEGEATYVRPGLPFSFWDLDTIALIVVLTSVVVALMLAVLWYGWRSSKYRPPHSLYGDLPMRKAVELPYESIGKIYLYLTGLRQYDNRMFSIHRAAVCRTTGRIFPNCVDLFGRIRLDWTFLQKRLPGTWISWGSLDEEKQREIRRAHPTLEGLQTVYSCPEPSPRAITTEYALAKPGPLYVDLETKNILAWKNVPGTDLEVLLVFHPRKYYADTASR